MSYDPTKPYKHEILSLIESTWDTPYVQVERGIYPILTKKLDYREVQHTDGIGTKGLHHWEHRAFESAVIDALAMNLNDLLMVRAIPYSLQNHIVLPEDDHKAILEVVRSLSSECIKRQIAITGGETSVHNTVDGMDLSITVCGFIKEIIENRCKEDDILIGIKSNGLHSNGITAAREAVGEDSSLQDEFTRPTRMYFDDISSIFEKVTINGMMHITGGAFSKLKDILGECDAHIHHPKQLKPHEIFYKIHNTGVDEQKMYTTFNCGIGFVLSVPKDSAQEIIDLIPGTEEIGHVSKGSDMVHIDSAFSSSIVKI